VTAVLTALPQDKALAIFTAEHLTVSKALKAIAVGSTWPAFLGLRVATRVTEGLKLKAKAQLITDLEHIALTALLSFHTPAGRQLIEDLLQGHRERLPIIHHIVSWALWARGPASMGDGAEQIGVDLSTDAHREGADASHPQSLNMEEGTQFISAGLIAVCK